MKTEKYRLLFFERKARQHDLFIVIYCEIFENSGTPSFLLDIKGKDYFRTLFFLILRGICLKTLTIITINMLITLPFRVCFL